jgi:hypothetical protein
MLHAYCFYADAAEPCGVLDFTVSLPRQGSVEWQASVGNDEIPPISELPFSGELVCVQVDAGGTPVSSNTLVGRIDAEGCPAAVTSVPGSFNLNFDTTLCLGGDVSANCPDGAEYDECPDTFDPNRLSGCWSRSQFTFVCSTPTPVPSPTPTRPAQARLAITSVTSSSTGTIGGTIMATVTVTNQGNAASDPFLTFYYYSPDRGITFDDQYSGQRCSFPGLLAGQSSTCMGPIDVPQTIQPGVYYVGVVLTVADVPVASGAANTTITLSPAAAFATNGGS